MKISFIPSSEEAFINVEEPVAGKSLIPEWYKDINPNEDKFLKQCIPFFDTFCNGYIQKTWEDIYVESFNGEIHVSSSGPISVAGKRSYASIPVDNSFYNIEFIWQRQWQIELPKGYSGLITHPLNRFDLPFMTLSGIVDFDKYNHSKTGNIPFYIKNNFLGLIPKGTPMFQIIPIKRESWVSSKEKYNEEEITKKNNKRVIFGEGKGFYKKNFWQKKDFN